MHTDNNGQSYKLEGNKAIIQQNNTSVKIEVFPTITVEDKEYEVMFPDDCNKLFANKHLKEFTLNKLLQPTKNIKTMRKMFLHCKNLIELDLTNLNTDNVTNMEEMFCKCNNLKCLNISNFNTKNVIDMNLMFYNNEKLESLDLSSFNTEKVKYMNSMFYNMSSITSLNLSSFSYKSVKYFEDYFNCISLKQIDLSNFNMNISFLFCYSGIKMLDSIDMITFELYKTRKEYNEILKFYYKNNKEIYDKLIKLNIFNKLSEMFRCDRFNISDIYKALRIINVMTIVANAKQIDYCLYDINCNNSYTTGYIK